MTAGQARYVVIAVTLSLALSICALGLVVLGRFGLTEMVREVERAERLKDVEMERSIGNLRQWAIAVYERLDKTCGAEIPPVPENR